MLRVKSVYLLPLLLSLIATLPATAQSTGVGKKGIYGRSTTDPEGAAVKPKTSAPAPAKPAPLTEEQKRLRAKYPLSTTGKTGNNQRAHTMMLQGIQLYHQTRAIFTAANEITSTYSDAESELEVSQKGVIQARLQPSDLLLYGPENAYISLRMRALQDADRTISRSIASFSQAQSLAPSLGAVPKWLRVARDTQKAVRYHIRFYQLSLKAVSMGYTDKELAYLAKRWSAPNKVKPEDTLSTRVNTTAFDALRRRGKPADTGESVERPSLDGFVDQLPGLDFKVLQ